MNKIMGEGGEGGGDLNIKVKGIYNFFVEFYVASDVKFVYMLVVTFKHTSKCNFVLMFRAIVYL